MKNIVRFIKSLFGKYETGYEYWVYTKDIIVPEEYKKSRVRNEKWKRKMEYYLRTGNFESPIILHKDFTLFDGYSSMKIAHLSGVEKVPVYFVD